MKLNLFITFFYSILLVVPLHADNSSPKGFLCIPSHAVGYNFRGGKWLPANFKIEGKKYFLREKEKKWYWTNFGEKYHEHLDLCKPFNELGFTWCENGEDRIMFNSKTLRYQIVRAYGYVTSNKKLDIEHPATPFYEIGTCSAL